jgi:hypothetical protein
MTRLLTLPITIPLRIVAFELRLARGAVGLALDITRDLAGGSPLDRESEGEGEGEGAAQPAVPPRPVAPDPAEAPRRARRDAAVQRTRARREPPAATTATDVPPPAAEEAPRPRPRRAARKATAAKPTRKRTTGPTRGEAAAIREAQRETEGTAPVASAGPDTGAGPEIHIEPPWPGYDEMALDEVLARLAGADETLVAAVRLYESGHESRQAILLATETP